MMGFKSAAEMMKRKVHTLYKNPGYRNVFLETLKKKGKIIDFENEMVTKDGYVKNVYVSATLIGDEISGMIMDISSRKKAEETVRKAAEEWNRTFDAISDLVFIQDKEFRITHANKSLLDSFSAKPEDIIGKKCYEIFHKTSKPWLNCPFEKTRKDKSAHTEEVFDSNIGIPLLVTTSPILNDQGQFMGSIHIAKDISEIKKSEEALKQTSLDLVRAQEVAQAGSWRLDILKNELTWSDENYNLFEIPKGTRLTYEKFLSTIHPEDQNYVDAKWKACLTGQPYDVEHRIIAGGKIKWVREKAFLEFDK
jgi:PAS domain S-box-containing protein